MSPLNLFQYKNSFMSIPLSSEEAGDKGGEVNNIILTSTPVDVYIFNDTFRFVPELAQFFTQFI